MRDFKFTIVTIALLVLWGCEKEPSDNGENNAKGAVSELNGFEYFGKTDFEPELEPIDIDRHSIKYANKLTDGFDMVCGVLVNHNNGASNWRAYRIQFDLNKNKLKNVQTEVSNLYYSKSLKLSDLHLVSSFDNSLIYYTSDYISSQPATVEIERVMANCVGSLNPTNAYVYAGRIARILYVNSEYFIYDDWGGDILNGVVMEDTSFLYIGQTKQWSNNDMYVGRSTKNIKRTYHGSVEQFWWDTDQYSFTKIAAQSGGDSQSKIAFVKGTKVGDNYIVAVYFSNGVGKKYSVNPANYQLTEIGTYTTDLIKSENVEMLSDGSLLCGLNHVNGLGYYDLTAPADIKIVDVNTSTSVTLPVFNTDDQEFKYYSYTNNDYLYILAYYKGEAYFYRKKLV